jgi:preprotein translocase subunit YajC
MVILLIGFLYFGMIRPQQRQKKQRNEMLSKLNVGDNIETIGGIIGKIVKMNEEIITIKIARETEIEMRKWAINSVKNPGEDK